MPYDYLTINEAGLNSGLVSASYFDTKIQELYEQQIIDEDLFFGDSDEDLIELSIYDTDQNLINFNRIIPKITYSVLEGQFRDINNNLTSFKVSNPFTNFVKNKNQILLHSQFDLKYNELPPGVYYLLYNPVRNLAGNPENKLVIKEISPNRTEIRLSFAFNPTKNVKSNIDAIKTSAFANKNYLFLQIIDEIIPIIDNNPIEKDFLLNQNNFNLFAIAGYLGLKSIAELQEFISSTYEGFNKILNLTTDVDNTIYQTKEFVGVKQQLKNFVYKYNQSEFTASELFDAIKIIVLKVSQDRILERTSLTQPVLADILNFFLKIIYTDWLLPEITKLLNNYKSYFYDYYKNVLNFDNGNFVKIINHTSYVNTVDNRVNVQVKLDTPLPLEYDIQSLCWISNVSISPVYFKVNLFSKPISRKVFLNGINFNVEVLTSPAANQNFQEYDLENLDSIKSKLKQKINDLYLDYDNFDNFINYSSAELRSKIAKNKILTYSKLESEKKYISQIANTSNTSISNSYSNEFNKKIKDQINLLKTFDEYESYLFFNTSSINEKIDDGVNFDKNNYNSLVSQLPEYVQTNSESEDYVKFTAMVGHFFDNILIFIKKFPKNYPLTNNDLNYYPKNYIEELLNSLNWNFDISKFEQSNIKQLFFNREEYTGSLSQSYFDYSKALLNRMANNISAIYKTKGTSTSFDLIRNIFGIPSEILQVKEYGSADLSSIISENLYYDFDDSIYMTKFDSNKFVTFNHTGSDFIYIQNTVNFSSSIGSPPTSSVEITPVFTGVSTVEFSFKFNSKNYDINQKIPLIKKLRNNKIDWSVYINKSKQTDSGKLIFDFNPIEIGSRITSSIILDDLPVLNGDIFTVMLRRDVIPGYEFDRNEISSSTKKIEIANYVIEDDNDFVVEDDNDNVVLGNVSSSLTSSTFVKNYREYVPYLYTLSANQFYGSQQNFSVSKNKVYTFDTNRFFSSGSYYFGNYSSSINFIGTLDKVKVFNFALDDKDFEEHSYNLDSISIPDKEIVYKNLYHLWSFDTPISLFNTSSNYISIKNQNSYYKTTFKAYNFTREKKEFGYPICNTMSVDEFPYQFEKINLKQAINSNNYGPIFKYNAKINRVNQKANSNLVPNDYSTTITDVLGDDSNLVQFGISPYSYLNRKIENFLGKEGVVNIIGDPKYLSSQNYPELKKLLNEFKIKNTRYIYPQEFYTTYNFYIDFSIFEFAKKLKPSRVNLLTGLVLEPTVFERNKFNYRDVIFEENRFLDITFNNKSTFTSSLINTNNTSSNVILDSLYNSFKTDPNTYNYSSFEIKDRIDDRDFIFSKFGKYINIDSDGFTIRNVNLVHQKDEYSVLNNRIKFSTSGTTGTTGTAGTTGTTGTSGTSGTSGASAVNRNKDKSNGYVTIFSSSYFVVQTLGSGSGYGLRERLGTSGTTGTAGFITPGYSVQITGSRVLNIKYTGDINNGYSRRHLSKLNIPGSRNSYLAVSSSKYTIENGIKTRLPSGKIKYYTYVKGENSKETTINRQGLPNNSLPVISIPGFISLNISSYSFPAYGVTTGSVSEPTSEFLQLPLTASLETSASIERYIKNL